MSPQNVYFIKNSVFRCLFCSDTTIFVRQRRFWKKCAFLCPVFWVGTLIGQKWCTLSCAQLEKKKKTKKLWNHYFSAVIWLWLFSNQSQMWHRKQKRKHYLCTLVFLLSCIRFGFKSSLVMFGKKHCFFCRFFWFCICFQKPLFLMLAFPFVGFLFLCFLFACCCCWTNHVAMFWFLFLLFWVSFVWFCFMCCVFLVCFWFGLFGEGLRVRWGGPKGHLNWP